VFPSAFKYAAPKCVDEAVALLADDEDAKVLAGGQSLIPMMKLRFARPSLLVDIARIPELSRVRRFDGEVCIGAMVRERDLVAGTDLYDLPILADTARVIADPLVRNSASIGGNLAHGDPENDQPATMTALDAAFVVRGPSGERVVEAENFFRDLYETALEPADVLTDIRIPIPPPGTGGAYVKLRRQVGDFAIVAVAAVLRVVHTEVVDCRLMFTGLGPTPVRAEQTERLLVGARANETTFVESARHCADTLDIVDGAQGPAGYLRRAVYAVTRTALQVAAKRAMEGSS
jgi:carbon-monoxide dehydrogenase medium subunit